MEYAPNLTAFPAIHSWHLHRLAETDSTNNEAKRLVAQGVSHGTAILATAQKGGRGRLGRQFSSPTGGLYLTALLHTKLPPDLLLHLTPMTAVAVRRGIEKACGLSVQIKWINDLIWQGKKLGGILTELVPKEDGTWVIIGIGINGTTDPQNLPPEVRSMAVSLEQITGQPPDLSRLADSILQELSKMAEEFLSHQAQWMEEYAANCATLGKAVQVVRGDYRRKAFVLGIDPEGGLRVRYENREEETVSSGEVSIRGMYGYTDDF